MSQSSALVVQSKGQVSIASPDTSCLAEITAADFKKVQNKMRDSNRLATGAMGVAFRAGGPFALQAVTDVLCWNLQMSSKKVFNGPQPARVGNDVSQAQRARQLVLN